MVSLYVPEHSSRFFYQLCAGAAPERQDACRYALELKSVLDPYLFGLSPVKIDAGHALESTIPDSLSCLD